jgi:hypothetical protein
LRIAVGLLIRIAIVSEQEVGRKVAETAQGKAQEHLLTIGIYLVADAQVYVPTVARAQETQRYLVLDELALAIIESGVIS